jgi:VanZ family protein
MKTIVKRWTPAILYACFILSLSSIPSQKLKSPIFAHYDKILHTLLYAGAYLAFYFSIRKPIFTLALVLCFAAFDEYYQSFIPGRHCNFYDWIADSIGATTAMISCLIYARYKNHPTTH